MLGRRTLKLIEQHDTSYPWKYVAPVFRAADIAFINLEGVASERGAALQKRYAFRFPQYTLAGARDAGIDVVSIANNHTLDYGYIGMCDTYKTLIEQEMSPIGAGCNRAQAIAPVIRELPDGTRVAFFAISEFYQGNTATKSSPGFAPYSPKWIMSAARALKKSGDADIVILSIHAGTEHVFTPNKRMQTLYKSIIEGGVDVVLGHHPHVPQPIQRYGDGWIVYSLGNLIFDMHDAIPHTTDQILAKISIQKGKVTSAGPIPIRMTEDFQPYLVADEEQVLAGGWEQ